MRDHDCYQFRAWVDFNQWIRGRGVVKAVPKWAVPSLCYDYDEGDALTGEEKRMISRFKGALRRAGFDPQRPGYVIKDKTGPHFHTPGYDEKTQGEAFFETRPAFGLPADCLYFWFPPLGAFAPLTGSER